MLTPLWTHSAWSLNPPLSLHNATASTLNKITSQIAPAEEDFHLKLHFFISLGLLYLRGGLPFSGTSITCTVTLEPCISSGYLTSSSNCKWQVICCLGTIWTDGNAALFFFSSPRQPNPAGDWSTPQILEWIHWTPRACYSVDFIIIHQKNFKFISLNGKFKIQLYSQGRLWTSAAHSYLQHFQQPLNLSNWSYGCSLADAAQDCTIVSSLLSPDESPVS